MRHADMAINSIGSCYAAGGDASAGFGSAVPSSVLAPSGAAPADDGQSPQTDAAGASPAKKLKAEAAQVLLSPMGRYLILRHAGKADSTCLQICIAGQQTSSCVRLYLAQSLMMHALTGAIPDRCRLDLQLCKAEFDWCEHGACGRRAQGALPAFLSAAAVTAAYATAKAPTADTPAGDGALPAFLSSAAVTAAYANGSATAAAGSDAAEDKA